MNLKLLVTFILLCSLLVAGCVSEEETDVTGEDVSGDNQSEISGENNVTTGTDNETPVTETPVDEEDTSAADEEEEDDSGVSVVESTGPRTYTVTLKNFLAQPSALTINEEDSVFWINMNQPNRVFVLVSNEDLWEDKSLTYRSSFTYTFDEPGEYNYYILGFEERMKGTITVK